MKISLTEGIGGNVIEDIAETDDINKAFSIIEKWKIANNGNYKVEPYNRFMGSEDDRSVTVDFGDYSNFIRIDGISFDDLVKPMKKD